MSRQILVVDSVCTNRILSAGDLAAARFSVRRADGLAAALSALSEAVPDLVIAAINAPESVSPLLGAIRSDTRTEALPVIAVGAEPSEAARLAALRAGADEVFARPVDNKLLMARIRSLLRRQDDLVELQAGQEPSPYLGFADEPEPFAVPGRAVILTGAQGELGPLLSGFHASLGWRCSLLRDEADIARSVSADVAVLDAADGAFDLAGAADAAARGRCLSAGGLFRAIAEIRAQPDNRHTEILVVVPPGATDLGAMALDLGASDLVTSEIGSDELAWRVDSLMRRKQLRDRLRDKVRDGLRAAVTDPLTGLHNRRFAMPVLTRLANDASAEEPLAVMVVDIDHFKAVNDSHGHAAGDQILMEIAERLRKALRPGDLLARIGGEEFLVAAPAIDPGAAAALGRRLCQAVRGEPVVVHSVLPEEHGPGPVVPVTVSVGLAIGTGESGERLFGRADAALYGAKHAGRDRMVGESDPGPMTVTAA